MRGSETMKQLWKAYDFSFLNIFFFLVAFVRVSLLFPRKGVTWW